MTARRTAPDPPAPADEIVAVLGSSRLAPILGRSWAVRQIGSADDLASMKVGTPARLWVIGGGRSSPIRIGETVRRVRSAAPLTDVLVWKPRASGEFVRSALKAGARDVVLEEDAASLVAAVEAAIESQRLLPEVEKLSRARYQNGRFEGLLSRNESMWEIFTTISQVAATAATVLISGETGTGKERIARAIHARSRRKGRFVPVNCSAIRPEIVQSELFGHEAGAFTGAARQEKGLFRHAEGGTLLLDEIGDMPGDAQLSLLRVLQENKVRPVGSTAEVPVDVRVLASTNARLEEAIESGSFREDLFYRLNVIRLDIPPLRERPEDVLHLLGHFMRIYCRRHGLKRPRVPDRVIDRLVEYDWPGNVRQLENVVERLVLEVQGDAFSLRGLNRALPREVSDRAESVADTTSTDAVAGSIDLGRTMAENVDPVVESLERRFLQAALRETRGAVAAAARTAGVNRRTMTRKLKRHGLDPADFR